MYQAILNYFDFRSANTFKHNTTNFSALLTSYDSCFPAFDKGLSAAPHPGKTKLKERVTSLLPLHTLIELTFKYIYIYAAHEDLFQILMKIPQNQIHTA